MKRKTFLFGALCAALLGTALYGAANLLSYNLSFRADLTRGKIYSITAGTKQLLAELDAPVILTLYISRELPPQVAVINDYTRNILREYENAGHGKVKIRVFEVSPGDAASREASERGVTPVVFDVFGKEKFEQREGVFGLVLQYKDKTERLPFIAGAENLEYDITSRINILTKKTLKRIGFVTSGGAQGLGALNPDFAKYLRTQFDISELKLDPANAAMPDALMLLGPAEKLAPAELYALDRYVSGGGALLCALDRLDVNLKGFVATPAPDTGLDPLLEHYGVRVSTMLALDTQNRPVEIMRKAEAAVLRNVVQYYPMISAKILNRGFPPSASLSALLLPFASPVYVTARDGSKNYIAGTSRASWLKPRDAGRKINGILALDISPLSDYIKTLPAKPTGPYPLAASLQKTFTPYFSAPPSGVTAPAVSAAGAKAGRIIVIGTSRFISADFEMPSENYVFFMNCAGWLAQDEALTAIRSKAAGFAPLSEIPAASKTLVKYANILLPPLFTALYGLVMWRLNLRRRARNARLFKPVKK